MQNHWPVLSWIQTNARLTRRSSVVKMVFNLAIIKFSPKEGGTAYQCTGAWLWNGYVHGSIFISMLRTLTAPLWELLKGSSIFNWTPLHQRAFDTVYEETNLGYYGLTNRWWVPWGLWATLDQGFLVTPWHMQSCDMLTLTGNSCM